ncbi:TPA: restriction endonuclease subunit S [Bacillus cereus]
MKKYPVYKDSEFKWLGEVPVEWDIKEVKQIYDFVSVKVSDEDYQALSVSSKSGITPQLEHVAKTLNGDNRKRVEKGDFVINSRADRPGACGVSEYDGSVSVICHVLRPKKAIILFPKYMHFLFRNPMFSQEFYRWGRGIVDDLWSTRKDEFSKIKIPIPPIDCQIVIGEYLDQQVENINDLIQKKVKIIELLEQKRQSMITEAVTKGLNPNVKMKDSGVEWIGEIPEYWNIKKMKYLAQGKMMYGANESAELDDRTLPRYIRITDIDQRGQLKEDTFKSLSKEVAAQYPVIKGDILFARSGATVGKTYHHDSEKIASFAGYLIRLRARKEYNSKYLYYYTQSSIYKEWIQSILIQATIQNVSAEKYADLLITIPSLKEMNQIVEYLERIDANIYSSLSLVTEQIQKLKDYRQSLIYEAVTGKIDVRDFEVKA